MSDLSQIEETMLGPLWARATYSERYPNLLDDKKANEIIKNIDYDFTAIKDHLGGWRSIGLMIRARRFDEALKNYMNNFPSTTVVNIGAGLDTTFFRIDNGKIKMYNLDLPEVIKYRNQLIPESERNLNIAHSVFDYNWINKIEFSKESGIFFISGGFIYYFEEEKISKLMKTLASKFPDGELIFDIVSNLAKKIINKKAEKVDSGLRFKLAMNDPYEIIPQWSEKIEIKDTFVIGKRTSLSKKVKFKTRVMNKLSQWMKISRIVHLKFLE